MNSARDNKVIEFNGSEAIDIGHVYKGDLNAHQQYQEVFQLRLKRGEAGMFELSSQVFDPLLKIMSSDGKELASNDDRAQDERDSRLVFAAPNDLAGSFYLVVNAVDKRGGDFTLTVTPRRLPAQPTSKTIAAGNPVKGSIGRESALRVQDQQIYASYFFDAVAGERVQLDGSAKLFEIGIELLYDGKVVNESDSGSSFAPSLYHPVAVSGRYQINVIAEPESAGDFDLRLKKLPKPRPAAPPTLIAIGETAPGEFLEDSPRLSPLGNRPYSLFQINGARGDSVVMWAALADPAVKPGDTYPISLEVGADTPAGFAAVRTRSEPSQRLGSRRVNVKFERPGPLLVRVAGRNGAVGKFTFTAERQEAERDAVASTTAN